MNENEEEVIILIDEPHQYYTQNRKRKPGKKTLVQRFLVRFSIPTIIAILSIVAVYGFEIMFCYDFESKVLDLKAIILFPILLIAFGTITLKIAKSWLSFITELEDI